MLPPSTAIHLGVVLVLLTPCTDWMNPFTLLGKGDAHRTLAATPLLLITQILLLPIFLWLLLESDTSRTVATEPFLQAFVGLVALPLSLAWLTEGWGKRGERVVSGIARSSVLPVVLLALVVPVIAASQIQHMLDHASQLTQVTLVFVLYVALAAVIGRLTVWLYSLPPKSGRGVIFSTGTRNSFVVLPLALALPSECRLAVAVIVIQAFVEMLGMLVCSGGAKSRAGVATLVHRLLAQGSQLHDRAAPVYRPVTLPSVQPASDRPAVPGRCRSG